MADRCDRIRNEIVGLKAQLALLAPFIIEPFDPDIDDPHGPRPKPKPNPAYTAMKGRIADAVSRLATCELSLLPPAIPVPVVITWTGLRCFDQNDTDRGVIFDLEDDEPYVLAFAMDLAVPQNLKLTKIGPLSDVDDEGQFFAAPNNVIWGLSGVADIPSSANNLVCIVALMENDDANPDTVRSLVEGALKFTVATELIAFATAAITRDEFVRRLINSMNGAIPPASVAFPGPDDQIGSAQELRIVQTELDDISRNSRIVEKQLRFEGAGARYDLYFRISR